MPVLLAKPREQSARRLCAANLAQIGKLLLMYANDYDDALVHDPDLFGSWSTIPSKKP